MAGSGEDEEGRYDSHGFDTQSPTYVEDVVSHVFGRDAPVHHYVVRSGDTQSRQELTVTDAIERRITQPDHYRAAPTGWCSRDIKHYSWYDTKNYIKLTLDFAGEVHLEQPEAAYIPAQKTLMFRVRIRQVFWHLHIPHIRGMIDHLSKPEISLVESEDGLLTTAAWKIYKETPVPWPTLSDR